MNAGRLTERGIVIGSLPHGLCLPASTSATAVPDSVRDTSTLMPPLTSRRGLPPASGRPLNSSDRLADRVQGVCQLVLPTHHVEAGWPPGGSPSTPREACSLPLTAGAPRGPLRHLDGFGDQPPVGLGRSGVTTRAAADGDLAPPDIPFLPILFFHVWFKIAVVC